MYNAVRRFHVRRQRQRRVQDDGNQGRGMRGDVGIQTMAERLETHLAAPRRRRRYSVGQSARAHFEKRLNGRVYWYYLVCTQYPAGMTTTPTPNPRTGWGEHASLAQGRRAGCHPPRPFSLVAPPNTDTTHPFGPNTPTPPGSHFPRTGMDGIKQPQWQGSSALGPMMYLHVQMVAVQMTESRTPRRRNPVLSAPHQYLTCPYPLGA